MFGYEFNRAVASGTLLVINTVLDKAGLDSFVGKTLVQMQSDSRLLAYSNTGNTTLTSSGLGEMPAAQDRRPRYKRHARVSVESLTTTLTQVANGEIKGLVLAVGNPCTRAAFLEFGVGKEANSVHKYIATETPAPTVTFTLTYQDVI